jgi:ArsR family transcriptional regulator, arsenate/arsenite/antimonite-responsive transcriptional repressor
VVVTDRQAAGNTEHPSNASLQRVFEALASAPRRRILAYLAHASLTAGEIAARFNISKPSISQHLSVLENAGLVVKERQGQFVHYSIVTDNLANTLNGFVQDVCPVARPIKKESRAIAERKASTPKNPQ